MKKVILLIFVIVISSYGFQVLSQTAEAGTPKVGVKSDTNDVLIGDHVIILLEFKAGKKNDVVWPLIADTIGHLEVLKRSTLDTQRQENLFLLRQTYTITSFDSGAYTIPSFTFSYEETAVAGKGGMPETILTNPLVLQFYTVEVDTTLDIKDIKGPLEEPVSFWEYLIYIVIALAVIALIVFGYYYWKKRKIKGTSDLDYDPNIPPHVLALEALKQLESEKLWQSGHVKKYYIRLTDIVRIYMKRQFHINAMEMITPEIISAMREYGFNQDIFDNMTDVFITADFAKFAKHQPLPDENAKCMKLSVDFVNKTIPIKTVPVEKPEAVKTEEKENQSNAKDSTEYVPKQGFGNKIEEHDAKDNGTEEVDN
ncbi:hypothetical protein ACFLSQ_00620 [Bacteroidota bacterium]